ncbi:MAG: hypothetical protein NVS4B8_21410 [Herpetosiphon sp.]
MNDQRRVEVRWQGDYRTQIDVRGVHQIIGDELPEYGGTDVGPMPTELLLASLGSCMCLAIAHVARKRRIAIIELSVLVNADKDDEAFRFREIELMIRADLPRERLTALIEQARRYCFVSNTITVGCPIRYTAQSLAPPDVTAASGTDA